MRRQENPCLLWLIAMAEWHLDFFERVQEVRPHVYTRGKLDTLREILDVYRWLDAEDEWAAADGFNSARYKTWMQWRLARMAEAGVA